jgi:hypothetical protein
MPTTKTRLNITLSPEMETAVKELAARDKISRAGKVTELLRTALEIEEDGVWNKLAEKRDLRGVKFVPHKKAWR